MCFSTYKFSIVDFTTTVSNLAVRLANFPLSIRVAQRAEILTVMVKLKISLTLILG